MWAKEASASLHKEMALKKTRKLNLQRETLRDLERPALALEIVLGGSLEPGSTHITVSETASRVGSGSCRV